MPKKVELTNDADDTQLFLSFSALDFSDNITHLENTRL